MAFREIKQAGMVFWLTGDFEQGNVALGVVRGAGNNVDVFFEPDALGAGIRGENAAGIEHFERTQIQFLVAAKCAFEGTF